ncbi:MAG: hypothetical protein QOK05_942 [Chloroflexota bacterium]|jgi:predicted metal-dependent enzyme (double-stranded beta helix superfamily)|nr:hypothetical protein [Chloroflexota bacterium]
MSSISLPRPQGSSPNPRPEGHTPLLDGLGLEPAERLLSRERLADITAAVADRAEVWRPHVRHQKRRRWFELLLVTEAVEIWLIGWSAGQWTPLHDHGGAFGALTVAEGQLTEVEFPDGAGGVRLRRVHDAPATVAFETHHVHRVGNRGPGNATSIHAYSPSNLSMRTYDEVEMSGSPQVSAEWEAAL